MTPQLYNYYKLLKDRVFKHATTEEKELPRQANIKAGWPYWLAGADTNAT